MATTTRGQGGLHLNWNNRVLHDVVTDEVPTSFEAPSYNKSEWQ